MEFACRRSSLLGDFERWCLGIIVRIEWSDLMSNVHVRNLVLSAGSENTLSKRIKLSRILWFGHLLRMTNMRPQYHTVTCNDFRFSHGVNADTWRSFDDVGAWNEKMYSEPRYGRCLTSCDWSPENLSTSWPAILRELANSQWWLFNHLSNQNG